MSADQTTSLHTVTITGTAEDPRIEFTCHGDRTADCHSYPNCDCETWTRDHPHEFVPHDECWMKSFFDNADDGGAHADPARRAADRRARVAVDALGDMLPGGAEFGAHINYSGQITPMTETHARRSLRPMRRWTHDWTEVTD